eukprot:PhM_4_TR4528/c0_g1_i1/m.71952
MSGWVVINILRGRNFSGTLGVDPFVDVYVDGDKVGSTQTAHKSTTPIWNTRFVVPIYREHGSIRLEVYDAEVTTRHVFLGAVTIDPNANGDADTAWFPVVKQKKPPPPPQSSSSSSFFRIGNGSGGGNSSAATDSDVAGSGAAVTLVTNGELRFSYNRSYSAIGCYYAPPPPYSLKSPDVPPFDFGDCKKQITRVSNHLYYACVPYWWLSERWMWSRPIESFVLMFCLTIGLYKGYFLAIVCFGMACYLAVNYVRRAEEQHSQKLGFRERARCLGEAEQHQKQWSYPDPFAVFHAFDNVQKQLLTVQIYTNWIGDLYDYYSEILLWQRPKTSKQVLTFFAAWTVLGWFELWPNIGTVLALINLYLFTLYPLYFYYPYLYTHITSLAFVSSLRTLIWETAILARNSTAKMTSSSTSSPNSPRNGNSNNRDSTHHGSMTGAGVGGRRSTSSLLSGANLRCEAGETLSEFDAIAIPVKPTTSKYASAMSLRGLNFLHEGGERCLHHLQHGGAVCAFLCKTLSTLELNERAAVHSFINLSGFDDEVAENHVPYIDTMSDADAGKYTTIVTKSMYLIGGKCSAAFFTPERVATHDFQDECQPGSKTISPDERQCYFRFTKEIIRFVFKMTVMFRVVEIRDEERLAEIQQFVDPELHHMPIDRVLLLERTKRVVSKVDATAKVKSLLVYRNVPNGVLVTNLTCVLNTSIPAVLSRVVNNLGSMGAAEVAETAHRTRAYVKKNFDASVATTTPPTTTTTPSAVAPSTTQRRPPSISIANSATTNVTPTTNTNANNTSNDYEAETAQHERIRKRNKSQVKVSL